MFQARQDVRLSPQTGRKIAAGIRDVENFYRHAPAERRILVAGEMLELGLESIPAHRECGRVAAESGIDLIVGVRGDAQYLVDAARETGDSRFQVIVNRASDAADDEAQENALARLLRARSSVA